MARGLVIGGSGSLGSVIAEHLGRTGLDVVRTSRAGGDGVMAFNPLGAPETLDGVAAAGPFASVVWAQGANRNDSIADLGLQGYRDTMDANVTFVVASLDGLLSRGAVGDGARLVVLSSIWQTLARENKFSYTVSKAAIGGLVRAASVDMAPRGILINAVLPSVIDTPMTRAMLSAEQVNFVSSQTGFGRLATTDDVAAQVTALATGANTATTGQSIAVDLGFSHARVL